MEAIEPTCHLQKRARQGDAPNHFAANLTSTRKETVWNPQIDVGSSCLESLESVVSPKDMEDILSLSLGTATTASFGENHSSATNFESSSNHISPLAFPGSSFYFPDFSGSTSFAACNNEEVYAPSLDIVMDDAENAVTCWPATWSRDPCVDIPINDGHLPAEAVPLPPNGQHFEPRPIPSVDNKKPENLPPVLSASVENTTPKHKWSKQEDKRLEEGIKLYKLPNWKLIAQHVKTRTNKMCAQRWRHAVRPELKVTRKGKWTKEEDEKLLQILSKEKCKNERTWDRASEAMGFGRNGMQCRERWNNFLDPNLRFEPWTPEEDACLLLLHTEFGNKWKMFTSTLIGRSAQRIRRRLGSLKRKR